LEDGLGGLADLIWGEGLVGCGEVAVLVRGVAEEEVEGGVAGEGAGGLLLEGEAGEGGGADAFEGFVGDAVLGDFLDFREEFAACEVCLVGGGGEVEGEEAGIVAEELGGADLVGEAEFFADASEEGAGHVGGVFLDEG